MAIREIVTVGDEILNKKCRKVEKFDEKLHLLLDDMRETLIKADGVGLAAPQVAVLRRVCIVDVGDEDGVIELINPEIISEKGEQTDVEGCLSAPGKYGYVTRPNEVTVKAQDRYGKEFTISGTELEARAFCHEIDHLDGVLYISRADEIFDEENN